MSDAMSWDAFLEKLDWEGGTVAMLEYGGPSCFPPEAQEAAQAVEDALKRLDEIIEGHTLLLG